MMANRSLAAVVLATLPLFGQAPAAPAAPATDLPAAGSPEATALVDKAIAKMQAYGRGTFATTQNNDQAMLRGQGLPFGNEDTEVTGGWHGAVVWGDHDGKQFARANGRMVAKVDGAWRLRGSKLEGGTPAPFTLDPEVLFTVLAGLPADARKVANVDAGEIGGKKVAVLSLALEGDVARDFADSGAVPGGAGGGFMMLGAPGMEMPENEYTAYLALFVDPESGDLLRFATKVFETNEMMGRVQIQVAGGGGGGDDEAEEEDDKEAPASDGKLAWKKGLPTKKPAKDQSVMSFRVEFKKLGLAESPALDDKAKALLRMQ